MVGLHPLLSFLPVVLGAPAAPLGFEEWAREYDKHYETEDEAQKARTILVQNQEVVKTLQDQEDGTAEYRLTRFGDVSPVDFQRTYMPRTMDAAEGQRGGSLPDLSGLLGEPPASADWRAQGAVTPVKDQVTKIPCGYLKMKASSLPFPLCFRPSMGQDTFLRDHEALMFSLEGDKVACMDYGAVQATEAHLQGAAEKLGPGGVAAVGAAGVAAVGAVAGTSLGSQGGGLLSPTTATAAISAASASLSAASPHSALFGNSEGGSGGTQGVK